MRVITLTKIERFIMRLKTFILACLILLFFNGSALSHYLEVTETRYRGLVPIGKRTYKVPCSSPKDCDETKVLIGKMPTEVNFTAYVDLKALDRDTFELSSRASSAYVGTPSDFSTVKKVEYAATDSTIDANIPAIRKVFNNIAYSLRRLIDKIRAKGSTAPLASKKLADAAVKAEQAVSYKISLLEEEERRLAIQK
jgi:hypothetical protein